MRSIREAEIKSGTKVLVRYDLDALFENPQTKKLELDTFRLDAGLETLQFIIGKGGIPIICGHIKNPESYSEELSTKQLTPYFDEKLGEGTYQLLENTKFDPRESSKDLDQKLTYAQELAANGEIYVNESFATSHRSYTSIVEIPKLLPGYAGIRLEKEIKVLSKVLENPERPLVAIIGGVKLESKKPTVDKFLIDADYVLLGGKLGLAWDGITPPHLVIPTDYAQDQLDIGDQTIKTFIEKIKVAKSIIWAGPMGFYEDERYINGTKLIAKAVIESQAYTVIGGGDTVSAFQKLGLLDKISFASTGGGAMLQYLVEGNLPGITALA